jgi:hypothetical protein
MVVQAMQWTGDNLAEITGFLDEDEFNHLPHHETLVLDVVHEHGSARKGDWVVRDGDGHLMSCDPNTFAATHEETNADGGQVIVHPEYPHPEVTRG